ncbi:MAG: hypothetical protein SCALA702_27950 [Melioribacteraceae bacterium]|nr:MAG: hypothetical protein SCALA702_27950 [Melioribacteraceae bacterium]
MLKYIKQYPVLKNILLMTGFGLLSLILGEIKITVPGMNSATTDLREIAVFTSIFYLPHWIYLIGISLITSLSIPEGGNYYVNIIMHVGAVITGFYIYHLFIKKLTEPIGLVILWSLTVTIIYYAVLLPLLVISSAFFGIIEFSSSFEIYTAIFSVIHFEMIATIALTSLVLISKNMRKVLLGKNFELARAKKRAEYSDKLKTEFLTQMSHEIRTPLNSILSFSGLLRETIPENQSNENSVIFNSITNSCKRIIRTVELILNISQMRTKTYDVKFVKLDLLSEIINPVIKDYQSVATSKNIKLKCDCKDSIKLKVDEYSTRIIFEQLIDNALKYTEKGVVKIVAKNGGTVSVVKIIDTGIGISEKYLPRLFEPFSQEEQGYTRAYDGNGLGLSLVKTCCDLNKIKIDIQSKKGSGTTVTLEIPFDHPTQHNDQTSGKAELLEADF